jgi:hypothetical protein
MSGAKIRDRRYLDPPPIVQVHVAPTSAEDDPAAVFHEALIDSDSLVMFASLWLP